MPIPNGDGKKVALNAGADYGAGSPKRYKAGFLPDIPEMKANTARDIGVKKYHGFLSFSSVCYRRF